MIDNRKKYSTYKKVEVLFFYVVQILKRYLPHSLSFFFDKYLSVISLTFCQYLVILDR